MHIFIEKSSDFSQVKILHSHVPLAACSRSHRRSALLASISVKGDMEKKYPPLRITFTEAIPLYLKRGEILLVTGTLSLSSLSCQDEEVDEVFGLREDEFLSQGLILRSPDHARSSHPRRVCHRVIPKQKFKACF